MDCALYGASFMFAYIRNEKKLFFFDRGPDIVLEFNLQQGHFAQFFLEGPRVFRLV